MHISHFFGTIDLELLLDIVIYVFDLAVRGHCPEVLRRTRIICYLAYLLPCSLDDSVSFLIWNTFFRYVQPISKSIVIALFWQGDDDGIPLTVV